MTTQIVENYQYIHKSNPWREFVEEMWFLHNDEVLTWTGKPITEYNFADYYRNNKWFLKNKFKKTQELL